jgi:hypothetical protein
VKRLNLIKAEVTKIGLKTRALFLHKYHNYHLSLVQRSQPNQNIINTRRLPPTKSKDLSTTPINLAPLPTNSNCIPPLQHQQRSIKGLFRIPLPLTNLPLQGRQTRGPPNRQPLFEFLLKLINFFVQLLASLVTAHINCVHGGC